MKSRARKENKGIERRGVEDESDLSSAIDFYEKEDIHNMSS